MLPAENAYGQRKRLEFCAAVIDAHRPSTVLDVGCGTGANLTRPLAERYSDVQFLGIDSDAASIAHARARPTLPNLRFGDDALARGVRADLIIASEVVEHVYEPEEFLAGLRGHLAPHGHVIVTLPNGWGTFEWASLLEVLFRASGIFDVLRTLKRSISVPPRASGERDTLAVSPHVNFFSYRAIGNAFAAAGLSVERYSARTFVCGFGFDHLVRGRRTVVWNARIADQLHPTCVSAWMFLLKASEPQSTKKYRPGFLARWQRRLNERYWRIAGSGDRCR